MQCNMSQAFQENLLSRKKKTYAVKLSDIPLISQNLPKVSKIAQKNLQNYLLTADSVYLRHAVKHDIFRYIL